MTTELLALADRVEAASELSRQDLIEIFKAVRPRSSFDTGKETDEARETFVRLWEAGGQIDAALLLAEPSWWFNTNAPLSPSAYGYSRPDERQPRAGFEMMGYPYSSGARGKTMGLATLGAILKARARAHASRVGDGRGESSVQLSDGEARG